MSDIKVPNQEIQDCLEAVHVVKTKIDRSKRQRTGKHASNADTDTSLESAKDNMRACIKKIIDSPLNQAYIPSKTYPLAIEGPMRRLYAEAKRLQESGDYQNRKTLLSLGNQLCEALDK